MHEGTEREAKVIVPLDFALPDLDGVVEGVTASDAPTAELVAAYFDTADRRLLRRAMTLRHRHDRARPGDSAEWTLKLPAAARGALLERTELNWPGADSEMPEEVRRLVRAPVRRAELVTVVRLITTRRRVELCDRDGRRLAEVADDTVSVMDGLRLADRFREVEVELDAGDDDLLDAVVDRLVSAGAVASPAMPKLARALRALGEPGDGPRPGAAGAIGPDAPVGAVVTAAVETGRERLLRHDIGIRLTGDVEDVHQARVATRRLRSDLRTFAEFLDPAWTARLRAELKWLGAALGRVRDADVLGEGLRARATEVLTDADAQGLRALEQRLGQERDEAYTELSADLDSDRYLDLLTELAADPPLVDGDGPGDRHEADRRPAARLVPVVRRPWRKLRRAVRDLGDDPSDQALHQVRIRAKRLRYAAEAVAPVAGEAATRMAEAAAGLQDVLGAQHDAVTAEAWLRRAAATSRGGRALFVAGALVAAERQEQARRRAEWPAVWEALDRRRLRRWLR